MAGGLPAGWELRVSRSKGRVFYHNARTQETRWVRPEAADVDADVDAAGDQREPPAKRQRMTEGESEQPVAADGAASGGAGGGSALRALVAASMRAGGASTRGSRSTPVAFSPWEHQLAAVERLVTAVQADSTASDQECERFLFQHSTGAGKTVTIAAAAHQLLLARDAAGRRFHTVLVVIDRVKLNEQVGGAVERFLRRNGVHEVFRAESIRHLSALLDGASAEAPQRVIVTTIHKMGLLAKEPVLLARLLHRQRNRSVANACADAETDKAVDVYQRVAIITDEAHRSHSAATRAAIEEVISSGSAVRPTFIGFTATPDASTLQLFGSETGDGLLVPFDCYPIARAVEEGRVMDVLADYTSLRCAVETNIPDAVVTSLRESGQLRRVLDQSSDDVAVLKAKSLAMMENFAKAKDQCPLLKCMIVTRSRRDVVRYRQLIAAFVRNRQLGWHVYAAFSGVVTTEGDAKQATVTEQSINDPGASLAISDVVIVCDKLDTGYNEPLLACMYIDRVLRSSSQTVQLLSRLNRRHPRKSFVRIVDFANHAANIRRSFADYWNAAQTPVSGDVVDAAATAMDAATASLLLCDEFPQLVQDSASSPLQVREFVREVVLPLERDAFQQVADALRVLVDSSKAATHSPRLELWFPISYTLAMEIKAELERHVAPSKAVDEATTAVMKKMAARVKDYETTFRGVISPRSLLDRASRALSATEVVSSLLLGREVEHFEALLALWQARRNSKMSPELELLAERARRVTTALPKSLSSAEGRPAPRLRSRITDMIEKACLV